LVAIGRVQAHERQEEFEIAEEYRLVMKLRRKKVQKDTPNTLGAPYSVLFLW
jgi:hypothetical protein